MHMISCAGSVFARRPRIFIARVSERSLREKEGGGKKELVFEFAT